MSAWEVRDNYPFPEGKVEYVVQRGTKRDGDLETGAVVWNYGLACLIEAALNMRDGTVD